MSKEQTPTVTAAEPDVESVKYEPKEIINWEDLDAKMDLLRGIYANGCSTKRT
jgi:hypothetical protein